MEYFIQYSANEVHPCTLGEFVLKWWAARRGDCPNKTFIKRLFNRAQEADSRWVYSVKRDPRYRALVEELGVDIPTVYRYLYYNCSKHSNLLSQLSQLRRCIKQGDGTTLLYLNREEIVSTNNMRAHVADIPAFSYNSFIQTHGTYNSHWYLVCGGKGRNGYSWNFISFVTDSPNEITSILESFEWAYLHFLTNND